MLSLLSLYFISNLVWKNIKLVSFVCLQEGGGEAIVLGLVTNRRESVPGHGAAVCGNWFGLADSLHMPQPAVAGWARPRGREEFLMLSRAMSNSIPTCHRGWEAWRNLEDNALSNVHKLLRRRGGGGTQFRRRDRHSGTLCILHIIPLWFALSIPDM